MAAVMSVNVPVGLVPQRTSSLYSHTNPHTKQRPGTRRSTFDRRGLGFPSSTDRRSQAAGIPTSWSQSTLWSSQCDCGNAARLAGLSEDSARPTRQDSRMQALAALEGRTLPPAEEHRPDPADLELTAAMRSIVNAPLPRCSSNRILETNPRQVAALWSRVRRSKAFELEQEAGRVPSLCSNSERPDLPPRRGVEGRFENGDAPHRHAQGPGAHSTTTRSGSKTAAQTQRSRTSETAPSSATAPVSTTEASATGRKDSSYEGDRPSARRETVVDDNYRRSVVAYYTQFGIAPPERCSSIRLNRR